MKHNDLCVGIDLGTTNSVIATCFQEGKVLNTPVSKIERFTEFGTRTNRKTGRDELLPSFVYYYYDTKEGEYETIVGDLAKKMCGSQPYAVARSIKMQMGQPKVRIPGWKAEYPDQTPEAVSSRILRHMLMGLEDFYGEKITDAVITIPASFDAAQSEATLRAAEMAGLDVRGDDGEYRDDVLLSEPEAVIYDVINQIQNGRINVPIDFSTPKRVMVFDIGGGTLDITLHEICRREDNPEYFDIRPLATNRFSMVAGDTFDEQLAEKMFEDYLEACRQGGLDEVVRGIRENRDAIMHELMTYAEELKTEISNRYKVRQQRGNPLRLDDDFEYGGRMLNGYSSEGYMTLGEFEECLRPLLGERYHYEDYHRFETIQDENNIIYPVLNVLYKAAAKLKVQDVQVDAVILNGGMSRLYLIEKRLTEFFGFRPITVNDPDKSVAQGAAVYHYYLHQKDSPMQELHRRFMEEQRSGQVPVESTVATAGKFVFQDITQEPPKQAIRSVASVLNESLYLGLRGGAVHLLAESGQELPYDSGKISGFSIAPGQTRLRIPIRQRSGRPGEYKTIATGNLTFSKARNKETPVSIQFRLKKGGLLTFEAWTSSDPQGLQVIESASVSLTLGEAEDKTRSYAKPNPIIPPTGTVLMVANELSSFRGLIDRLKTCRKKTAKTSLLNAIKTRKKTIIGCGNPEEFSEGILKMLETDNSAIMYMNLLPVARKLSAFWTEEERKKLARLCLRSLESELTGWGSSNFEVSANNEAILTIGSCADREVCKQLKPLQDKLKYRNALLFAFGSCGICQKWIYEQFVSDMERSAVMQESIRCLGLSAFRYDCDMEINTREAAERLTLLISGGSLQDNELSIAIVALGILYTRLQGEERELVFQQAREAISSIPTYYGSKMWEYTEKARSVAHRMMTGEELEKSEEEFLLSILTQM